jgi:phosphoglycolate phosphatase
LTFYTLHYKIEKENMSEDPYMGNFCIFDFDGTLANTLSSIAYFGNRALQAHGLQELPSDTYRNMVGNGAAVLLRRMVKASYGREEEELIRKVKETYDTLYDEKPAYLVKPYDGIPLVLETLKKEGWLIGVNSNKPDHLTKKIAETVFGRGLFDFILGQRQEIPKKPNPQGAIQIMDILQVQARDGFYIGDSDVDVQTGKNAGLRTIGAAWGFRGQDELIRAGADMIVQDPMSLLNCIRFPEQINGRVDSGTECLEK